MSDTLRTLCSMNICKVDQCDKPIKSKDNVCSMHRARWSRHGTFDYVGRKPVPIKDSIEERIVRASDDECWAWAGYHNQGYAVLRRKIDGNIKVHRWVYAEYVGELIDGLVIDHACGKRGCLNPKHLRQITNRKNVENFTTPTRSHNTSGFRGVHFHRASGLWVASVNTSGRRIVSYHKTKEEAAKAAIELRLRHHTHNELDRLTG